ncbi:MAG: putative repair protein RecO [Alphaproteobacteria bacterium]|jgi:DNA repair protein RecO (recombination protein O)|nr:putative repair protein RecO [Alphaproteobacteria bacterium]
MKWTDSGIVLSTRSFGENSRIVSLLTRQYGRHAGLVKVPKSRSRLSLEAGAFVEATWNARLSEHLGQWSFETTAAMGAKLLSRPLPLAALSSACSLTDQCLAERHPYPDLYVLLKCLIEDLVHTPDWPVAYVNYELALLKDLGFGLDLSSCAATGQRHDLIYISPRTGRAVSREAGEPYKAKLLPLPPWWVDDQVPPDIQVSLTVTGCFLAQHLTGRQGLPAIRQRLVEMLAVTARP